MRASHRKVPILLAALALTGAGVLGVPAAANASPYQACLNNHGVITVCVTAGHAANGLITFHATYTNVSGSDLWICSSWMGGFTSGGSLAWQTPTYTYPYQSWIHPGATVQIQKSYSQTSWNGSIHASFGLWTGGGCADGSGGEASPVRTW